MRWLKFMVCLALCNLLCGSARFPKDLLPAREEFEVGLQVADKQDQERITAVGDAYLQRLRELARQQQFKGRFRGLVTVRDEIARFAKARTFPDHPVEEPVELHDAQALYQLKWQQTQYSNEFAIVKLAEHYVQALAVARDALEKSNTVDSVQVLDDECDRVVALARLRQALEATKVRPATSLPKPPPSTVAAASTTDARIRRPLDIFRPSNEPLTSMISYEAHAVLFEDLSQLKTHKTAGAGNAYRSLDGQVAYTPRITLTCHRGELLSGTKLVIEYFSRSLPDHVLHHEVVERVLLPRLDRGTSYTVEAKGVQLSRSEQVSVIQSAGVSVSHFGAEFYGLILHLVDPDGRVIWQRFSPQALERELAALPPEK
jgi:hypothetical protein